MKTKNRTGSGSLIVTLALSSTLIFIALASAHFSNTEYKSIIYQKKYNEAMQIGENAFAFATEIPYDELELLAAEAKNTVTGSKLQREIIISPEQIVDLNKFSKTLTVNIYDLDDKLLFSQERNYFSGSSASASNLQVRTGTNSLTISANDNYSMITVLITTSFNIQSSSYIGADFQYYSRFAISHNGTALEYPNLSTSVSSTTTHNYYYYAPARIKQSIFSRNVNAGDTISVILTANSLFYNRSKITIILSK